MKIPAGGEQRSASQGPVPTARFSEASYYLWCGKFGGMRVPDAKRLKGLKARMRAWKLLAEAMLENEAPREVYRNSGEDTRIVKWCAHWRIVG